jgi:hypothetical protein
MRLLVLDFGLFPDRETVATAVARLAEGHEVRRATPAGNADDLEWDRVLAEIRAADLVLTT